MGSRGSRRDVFPAPQPLPQAQSPVSRAPPPPGTHTDPGLLVSGQGQKGFVQRTFQVCRWHLVGDEVGGPALGGPTLILWEENQDMGYLMFEHQRVGGQDWWEGGQVMVGGLEVLV